MMFDHLRLIELGRAAMDSIIDVSSACGARAAALAAAGVHTVIRYYSRDTIRPTKRLTRQEALQHCSAGLTIGIVHEGRHGDQAANFDYATGLADAQYARTYGATVIEQPAGTTIYFAVDFDATATQIRDRILPYFRGITDAWLNASGEPNYVIGVYGSGATCKAVVDAGLAQRAWLAQSTGWASYTAFSDSKAWALRQRMPAAIAGVDCDPNVASETITLGDFSVAAQVVPQAAMRVRVNARHGLRLRPGPSTDFDPVATLPFGREVVPLKVVGAWTLVDLEGDGAADGFVSSAYLADARSVATDLQSPTTEMATATGDALHIPELIRQGSTGSGLKTAKLTAAAALPGYPHNGCAAHLSALLEQAGIDVTMTWGAGKLAHRLSDRGWAKVTVGHQQPGDVGVCYDNDPNVGGADHIYLVVGAVGTDEMMIADNQRTTDAPHRRFASGQGKTPTEYFLRA
jgi:hypothetical protein